MTLLRIPVLLGTEFMNRRNLSSLLVLLLLALMFSTPVSAQSRNKSRQRKAAMFDEYGTLSYCSVTARLDNFAIQLENDRSQQGYLIIYGPPGEGRGFGTDSVERQKGYLVNARSIEEERLTTIYAGRNDVLTEIRVQLWIGPAGAPAPEPKKFNVHPENFKGMYEESEGYDEITNYVDDGEGEMENLFPGVWMAGFADVVKSQTNSLIYIAGYNGESSVPGAWRRLAEREVDGFKKAGIPANRFKIIYGGNEEKAKTQIWIQPANDQPPVKDAGAEPALSAAVQLGDFGDYDLGYKDYERRAFNRLLETLRAFPTLRACIIVRIEQPAPKEEEMEVMTSGVIVQPNEVTDVPTENAAAQPEPDPEPADLLKLVDSWKGELSQQNIREDRLVILFSKALPDRAGTLETWLIPNGHPLPDPEAIFKEESEPKDSKAVTNGKP